MPRSTCLDSGYAGLMPGAVIGGKYRLDALVAEGGMGLVYRATHVVLELPVALKIMRPELAERADAIARFLLEARTIASLRGEHVARVLDSGAIKDGPPYMVLEYLTGADLRTHLQGEAAFEISRAVDFVLQVCEALAEAHTRGLVHRDIKPENLFLTRSADGTEVIKVLDFGISKRLDDARSRSYTADGETLGSPSYMAPEQVSAPADVDARADIWSLGVVAFELLSGRLPFEQGAPDRMRFWGKRGSVLRACRPEVPVELERVILGCLRREPGERYGSVAELGEALAPFGTSVATEALTRIRRYAQPASQSAAELSLRVEGARGAVTPKSVRPRVRTSGRRVLAVTTALLSAFTILAVPSFRPLERAAVYVARGVAATARGQTFDSASAHERRAITANAKD